MGSRARRKQRYTVQPLTPLMEGPDLEMREEEGKKEGSWDMIREWFRLQRNISPGRGGDGITGNWNSGDRDKCLGVPKRHDLRLLLGVLGCPLAPIPVGPQFGNCGHMPCLRDDIPIESSMAHYIIQQYLASAGCLKQQKHRNDSIKNMYATGVVKMICCETEVVPPPSSPSSSSSSSSPPSVKKRRPSGESGCFVMWQMNPEMWSLELALGTASSAGAHKVIAGSDGKIVWRHTPWLGTHAAKGPRRPLRRIMQGLDPKSTASLFAKAQCLGEKQIGDEDCFVLKVSADRADVIERNEGPAEVLRHVLYGYFSQKSGLLVYMEDSHLTRVHVLSDNNNNNHNNINNSGEAVVYWETTIGSSIEDYRDVDGVLIAHEGRTIATVFRFAEGSMEHSRTRLEEMWRIDDVVFNVPGLSIDSFIPPADIFDSPLTSPT